MARLNEGEDGDTTGWVERLFLYITALAMQAFVSHAWAYFICAVAPTLSLGVFFAPLSSIPQFLICGFLIHTKDMSTFFEVLSYLGKFGRRIFFPSHSVGSCPSLTRFPVCL